MFSINAGTGMGRIGPFRALRRHFLDEREGTEARSFYMRARTFRVLAATHPDRQIGVFRAQWSVSRHPGVAANTPLGRKHSDVG